MSLKLVYEPIKINGLEVRNRISRSAHGTNLSDRGVISDRLIDYHVARAKGGVGLSILEASTVHPTSAVSLYNYDDSVIADYRRLMAAIRPHGMRVFQQIWHSGYCYPTPDQSPPWGVSTVPGPELGIVPNPMGIGEIAEVIASFAAAARRCREGGIDGVQVHVAHGYLLMQFLSPLVNTRTDKYGGSLENRMRIVQEVLRAVRAEVGYDYPVGIRAGASTGEGGLGEGELVKVVKALQEENLIDFLDASWSDYYDFKLIAAMDQPTGYQIPSSEKVTRAIKDIPRFIIGRFRTLEEAEQVIRDGVADLVHLNRAHIADPDIVRKTRAGHPEQVRPCIACNQGCWYNCNKGYPIGCTVNPAAGMEGTWSEDMIKPADNPGRVLVIGGGPAGMEAARVARLSGYDVTLAEAGPNLGGQVLAAKRAPYLHALGDITFWLEQEIYRLGVEVRTGAYMEAEDIVAEKPDYVVIATGAVPRDNGIQYHYPGSPIPGFNQPHVISAAELLTSRRELGASAVVFDDVGHYEAIAAAEYLLSKGLAVTFATRFESMGPHLDFLTRVEPAFKRFGAVGGFQLLLRSRLEEIRKDTCLVQPLYYKEPQVTPADTVVFVSAKEPMRTVYDDLREQGFVVGQNLVLIGDARAPRDLQWAITEGHRLVREMIGARSSVALAAAPG